MRFNRSWREEATLRDGTRVVLRLIRPEDREGLRDVFDRLSPESRYRRFLGGTSELSEEMLDYLTKVDGVDHVAVIATHETLDLKHEHIVGVSRFVRLSDEPDVAEAAITVVDDMQRKGLATLLSVPTREAAIERGITRFRAEVLLSNEPMRRLLEDAGARTGEPSGDTLEFDVPLLDEPLSVRPPLERVLAAAAGSMAVFIRRLVPTSSAPPSG